MKRFVLALAVVLASLSYVHAAEFDPRTEVTIQVSPLECLIVRSRIMASDRASTSEDESAARKRIGIACDFAGLEARSEAAAKAGWNPKDPKTYSRAPDFGGPRAPRRLARDALDMLVTVSPTSPGWLVPTKDHPVPTEQDATLGTLRLEFREILAGRNPYAAPAAK